MATKLSTSLTGCVLLLLAACSKETIKSPADAEASRAVGEEPPSGNSLPSSNAAVPDLVSRLIADPNEDDEVEFKRLISQCPEQLLRLLLESKPGSQRFLLLTMLFETLAEKDAAYALTLLPDGLSNREQLYWGKPIAIALAKARSMNQLLVFINGRFPSGARASVIEESIAALSESGAGIDELEQFWAGLLPHAGKDIGAFQLARAIVGLDPIYALEWYSRLERPEEKASALREIAARDVEGLIKQLSASKNNEVTSHVANVLGELASMKQLELGGIRSRVPTDLWAQIENSYIVAFDSGSGGSRESATLAAEYIGKASSQEAKDACQRIIIKDKFGRNPIEGANLVLSSGLAERSPSDWNEYIVRWLNTDSLEASKYVTGLPSGPQRQLAAVQIHNYLKDTGDASAAEAWRKEAGPLLPSPLK